MYCKVEKRADLKLLGQVVKSQRDVGRGGVESQESQLFSTVKSKFRSSSTAWGFGHSEKNEPRYEQDCPDRDRAVGN